MENRLKVRLGLTVMGSVVAIGTALALGGSPALANQADHFSIENSSHTAYYMQTNNVPNFPLFVEAGDNNQAIFSNINGSHKSILGTTRPVYEWKQVGTNRCWTYESDTSYLVTKTCVAGRTSQLFWQPVDGQADRQFINVWASNTRGAYYCVNASHASDGAKINVIRCKRKSDPGGFDQYWYPY